jgi:iron complex transport system permease protein
MTARTLIFGLIAGLLLSSIVSLTIGPVPLDWSTLLSQWGRGSSAGDAVILIDIRLPRLLAALVVGAALGASGTALQAMLRNPLAEPGVMGVSASAATAATATVYFGAAAAAPWLVPVAAMLGAMAATGLIASAAMRFRGVATLVLMGVSLSAFAGAIMALFVNLATNPFSLSDLINWTAGSVANRDLVAVGWSLPPVMAGIALLWSRRRDLSAMALGEEAAFAIGVDLPRARLLVVIGAGLATGGAVALAGMIGFVGLVAPHAVRFTVGHDNGRALLPSALAGALLVALADLGIRLMPWGNELHLGTLAALIGAPLFALLAIRLGTVRHG